ncbi:MAG TPA: ArsA family ATPase [Archaeoglobaceae archaeon]|nr:ArsA family ATPase [Archaeoglobaceae archaeon]
MTRIILFTGKGGVGKTTVAAATAIKTSKMGYRTLLISTDPAHSLSDSLQVALKPYPTEVRNNLYGMEVNVEYELEKHWNVIKDYLTLFFKSQGIEDVIAEELAIFPGFDELASLLHLLKFYEENEYDVIILDCAPTGETLRLLSVPEVARWYMNRFFGIEKRVLKLVKPIAEPIINLPLPSDDVLDRIQEMYVKMGKLKEILESENTVVRLVMNPEKMVIKESERAFTYLNLFGYRVDCIIVNKVFPEEAGDYFTEWVKIQKNNLKEIEEKFPIPLFKIPFKSAEIVGDLLYELSESLYDGKDPSEVFHHEKPMRIEKEGEDFILAVKTPFVKKEELDLMKRGDELIIIAGQWKRIFFLPQSLAMREPAGASFNKGELHIKFR